MASFWPYQCANSPILCDSSQIVHQIRSHVPTDHRKECARFNLLFSRFFDCLLWPNPCYLIAVDEMGQRIDDLETQMQEKMKKVQQAEDDEAEGTEPPQ